MQFQLTMNPRLVGTILAGISFLLAGLSLIAEYIVEVIYRDVDYAWLRLIDLFSVNLEASIPTWFATILLFVAATLLVMITLMIWYTERPYRWHWLGLAGIFFYLSMDEGAVIHEVAADPLTQFFNTSGYLYFGWQIVFVPLTLIVAFIYLGFVFHLPPKTRHGILTAGVIYVGGAIVIEGFSADLLAAADGVYTYRYLATATLEELCEMLGIALFIYTLLDYVVRYEGQFTLTSPAHSSARERDVAKEDDNWFQKSLESLRNSPHRNHVIMFMLGVNIFIIPWFVLREAGAIVPHSDVLITGIGIVFVLGLGIGRLSRHWWQQNSGVWLSLPLIVIPVTLPIWFRLLDVTVGNTLTDALWMGMTVLITTGFYGIYCTSSINFTENRLHIPLMLTGGIVSIALIMLFARSGYYPLLVIYAILSLSLLLLQGTQQKPWLRVALVTATGLWFLPALNQWSNTVWYQAQTNLPATITTIYSDYSLNQKIDVLEDTNGNRFLYQDGIAGFNPHTDHIKNILMGRVPASLMQPDATLVIGAGSMQMELMIANYAGFVTTVEPDARVAAVSEHLFTSYNRMDQLDNRQVVIADPAAFLNDHDTRIDMIALDVSSDYNAQTSHWYTTGFFEQVASSLHEDGVFTLNLTEPLTPDNPIARRLAASLLVTFDDIWIVNTNDTAIAFASDNLPFTRANVQAALQSISNPSGYGLFETAAVQAISDDAQPIDELTDWATNTPPLD